MPRRNTPRPTSSPIVRIARLESGFRDHETRITASEKLLREHDKDLATLADVMFRTAKRAGAGIRTRLRTARRARR